MDAYKKYTQLIMILLLAGCGRPDIICIDRCQLVDPRSEYVIRIQWCTPGKYQSIIMERVCDHRVVTVADGNSRMSRELKVAEYEQIVGGIFDGVMADNMAVPVGDHDNLSEILYIEIYWRNRSCNIGISRESNGAIYDKINELIIFINSKMSAQQVDSAEASTIAVPPSVPSGSPR